jgi:hypothetical protein
MLVLVVICRPLDNGYPKAQPAIKNRTLLVNFFNVEFSNLMTMRLCFSYGANVEYYF